MTLIGVEKLTVNTGVQYTPLTDVKLDASLIKMLTNIDCVNALSKLGLTENTKWLEMKTHYALLTDLEPYLKNRLESLK